jgi:pimeloyl-ACP methyl ester carboxylesterase
MTIEFGQTGVIDRLIDGQPATVFLHGWCCRTGDFAEVINQLGPERSILAIDWQERMRMRGSDCSFAGICDDIVNLLVGANLERPLVCGHSLGGSLALLLATNQRVRLGGVLALDSTVLLEEETRAVLRYWIAQLEPQTAAGFYATYLTDRFFTPDEIGALSEAIVSNMQAVELGEARELLRQALEVGWADVVSSLRCPVHYVASSINQHFTAARLASLLPEAGFERVDNAGHFMQVFEPERVAQMITRLQPALLGDR